MAELQLQQLAGEVAAAEPKRQKEQRAEERGAANKRCVCVQPPQLLGS